MRSRRRFLRHALAAPLLPAALTQTTPAPAPSPPPSPTPAPPTPEAAARERVAESLLEAARRHFADRFPDEHTDDVKQAIVENLRAGERLRALRHGNADEPVTVFEADPPPIRPAAATSPGTGRARK